MVAKRASPTRYRFDHLPRYTQSDLRLQEALLRTLGDEAFAADFLPKVSETLRALVNEPVRLIEPEAVALAADVPPQALGEEGCFVILALGPSEHRLVVDVDVHLASIFLDRLLGGQGKAPQIHRLLTDVETGILSYAALRVVETLKQSLKTGRELAISLVRTCSERAQALSLAPMTGRFAQLGIRVGIGDVLGAVRIFVPEGLLHAHPAQNAEFAELTSSEMASVRRRIDLLGGRPIDARVVAARLDLEPSEIKDLELGDIVVVEDHQLQLREGLLTGEVALRFGAGRSGHVQCHLRVEDEAVTLEVDDIVLTPEPSATSLEPIMSDSAEPDAPSDNLKETLGLLENAPAPVAIELARLTLSTAQVARMRRGQTFRLPRGPHDPVDLVVGDKRIGRGELIEIDGDLGVRLTQVTGDA